MATYSSQTIRKAGTWADAFAQCVLTYDARFLRRKVIKTVQNETLLVDLSHTTSLNQGDAFELADGRVIEVIAAKEPLLKITGDLVQLAWHIGNRHTPCQIQTDHLLIQNDPVIAHMLQHLGAEVAQIDQAFTPEGGAYGHGRTHSHEHVATAHDHQN